MCEDGRAGQLLEVSVFFSGKEEKSSELWGSRARPAPNVPKIFPTAETEEHLIWESELCLLVSPG